MLFSIVSPVYNEEEVIEDVIKRWKSIIKDNTMDAEIVLVNDGSTDKTPEILNKLQGENSNIKVIHLNKNKGYGRAISTAIGHSNGEYVITIDSDGQFDLADFQILYDKLVRGELDCVTGFREKKKDSLVRVVADRALNVIFKVLFGIKIRDSNCALKLIKGEMLRQIRIEARGYPAPTEMLIKLAVEGANIGEAGIKHYFRPGGTSKLKLFRTGLNMFYFLIYLKWKIYLYSKKIINSI